MKFNNREELFKFLDEENKKNMPTLCHDDIMFFGKHRGTPLKDLKPSYLLWLWDNVLWNQLGNAEKGGLAVYVQGQIPNLLREVPDYILKHEVN